MENHNVIRMFVAAVCCVAGSLGPQRPFSRTRMRRISSVLYGRWRCGCTTARASISV